MNKTLQCPEVDAYPNCAAGRRRNGHSFRAAHGAWLPNGDIGIQGE
jgi:hypothetical protein